MFVKSVRVLACVFFMLGTAAHAQTGAREFPASDAVICMLRLYEMRSHWPI